MKTYFYIVFVTLFIFNSALAQEFGEWSGTKISSNEAMDNDGKAYCYIYSTPYRTKAYTGAREEPYLLIAKKGKDQYSIGVSSGFVLAKDSGFTLKTNSRTHLLNIRADQNAVTFTSIQDVAIIDDMIEDGVSVEIRSYQQTDQDINPALDFYSLKGFTKAMQFLDKCN